MFANNASARRGIQNFLSYCWAWNGQGATAGRCDVGWRHGDHAHVVRVQNCIVCMHHLGSCSSASSSAFCRRQRRFSCCCPAAAPYAGWLPELKRVASRTCQRHAELITLPACLGSEWPSLAHAIAGAIAAQAGSLLRSRAGAAHAAPCCTCSHCRQRALGQARLLATPARRPCMWPAVGLLTARTPPLCTAHSGAPHPQTRAGSARP